MSNALDEIFGILTQQEKEFALEALAHHKHGIRPVLNSMPVRALIAEPSAPLEFLVDGLVARGQLLMFGGRPKSGKSWLVLQLAKAIDTATPFLDRPTTGGRVLYAALEDGRRRFTERCRQLDWDANASAVAFRLDSFNVVNGDLGPGLEQLEEAAGEYDLIIIDTLLPTLSGRVSENDNTAMGAIVNEVARIAHSNDCAILLVHHTNKSYNDDDKFMLLRGASALRGAYDVGIVMERRRGEQEAVLHLEARDLDVSNLTIRQATDGVGWELVGEGEVLQQIRAGRQVVAALQVLGEATADELGAHLGVGRNSAYRQLVRAERDELVTRTAGLADGRGRPAEVWSLVGSGAPEMEQPPSLLPALICDCFPPSPKCST